MLDVVRGKDAHAGEIDNLPPVRVLRLQLLAALFAARYGVFLLIIGTHKIAPTTVGEHGVACKRKIVADAISFSHAPVLAFGSDPDLRRVLQRRTTQSEGGTVVEYL